MVDTRQRYSLACKIDDQPGSVQNSLKTDQDFLSSAFFYEAGLLRVKAVQYDSIINLFKWQNITRKVHSLNDTRKLFLARAINNALSSSYNSKPLG